MHKMLPQKNKKCLGLTHNLAVDTKPMASCGLPEFSFSFFRLSLKKKMKCGHFNKKRVKLNGTKTWDTNIASF